MWRVILRLRGYVKAEGMIKQDETVTPAESAGVYYSQSIEKGEEKLLRRLEAELEDVRRKKELAIGYDAYAFFCMKEKMLVKEMLRLRIRRAVRKQAQAKLFVEEKKHENRETLIMANT